MGMGNGTQEATLKLFTDGYCTSTVPYRTSTVRAHIQIPATKLSLNINAILQEAKIGHGGQKLRAMGYDRVRTMMAQG